jgi:hypothetical protein
MQRFILIRGRCDSNISSRRPSNESRAEGLSVGHTARAARTQPSHLPLLTLIIAPPSVAFNSKSAVPNEPVVDVGAPPHFVIALATFRRCPL